jgi:hypothetical protein
MIAVCSEHLRFLYYGKENPIDHQDIRLVISCLRNERRQIATAGLGDNWDANQTTGSVRNVRRAIEPVAILASSEDVFGRHAARRADGEIIHAHELADESADNVRFPSRRRHQGNKKTRPCGRVFCFALLVAGRLILLGERFLYPRVLIGRDSCRSEHGRSGVFDLAVLDSQRDCVYQQAFDVDLLLSLLVHVSDHSIDSIRCPVSSCTLPEVSPDTR